MKAVCVQTIVTVLIVAFLSCTLTNDRFAFGAPVIDWEISPVEPRVGETVTFDTSLSNKWANDTFGPLFYTYSWDFGDGTTAVGDTVTHIYAALGNYTVAMNTTDKTVIGAEVSDCLL